MRWPLSQKAVRCLVHQLYHSAMPQAPLQGGPGRQVITRTQHPAVRTASGKPSSFPPIPMWPQTPEGLSVPPSHIPQTRAHLLLCVTSFSLHRGHGHVPVDTLSPTDRHQTSPLLLVRPVLHFCNSEPAHRENSDLPLAAWPALFRLVGRFYEVPSLVPAALTHIPFNSTSHCVQMVTADMLPRGGPW